MDNRSATQLYIQLFRYGARWLTAAEIYEHWVAMLGSDRPWQSRYPAAYRHRCRHIRVINGSTGNQ